MMFWVDLQSPAEMFTRVRWPDQTPVPAVGDLVLLRAGDVTWTFSVTGRTIGVGVDPISLQPASHAVLQVDAAAPSGWDPRHLP